jgi:hypothetical protein
MIGCEFKEMWYERVNWIYVVQDDLEWWAVVKAIMSLLVSLKVENVLIK